MEFAINIFRQEYEKMKGNVKNKEISSNLYYFSKVFKTYEGLPPSQYRHTKK